MRQNSLLYKHKFSRLSDQNGLILYLYRTKTAQMRYPLALHKCTSTAYIGGSGVSLRSLNIQYLSTFLCNYEPFFIRRYGSSPNHLDWYARVDQLETEQDTTFVNLSVQLWTDSLCVETYNHRNYSWEGSKSSASIILSSPSLFQC